MEVNGDSRTPQSDTFLPPIINKSKLIAKNGEPKSFASQEKHETFIFEQNGGNSENNFTNGPDAFGILN